MNTALMPRHECSSGHHGAMQVMVSSVRFALLSKILGGDALLGWYGINNRHAGIHILRWMLNC